MEKKRKLQTCIIVSTMIVTLMTMLISMCLNVMQESIHQMDEYKFDEKAHYFAYTFIKNEKEDQEGKNTNIESDYEIGEEIIESEDLALYGEKVLTKLVRVVIESLYSSKDEVYELYFSSLLIGVLTGILVYLIYIEKVKAKKIIIISLIVFAVLFVVMNLKELIEDIVHSVEVKSLSINLDTYLNKMFSVYFIIFIILYLANFINQKRITKKLNKELNKKD